MSESQSQSQTPTIPPALIRAKALRLFFEKGLTGKDVAQRLEAEDGVSYTDSAIRGWAEDARKNDCVRYLAENDAHLSEKIKAKSIEKLENVAVVSSAYPEDVAAHGANQLLSIMYYHPNRAEIHVGLAGGRTPSLMAAVIADKLRNGQADPTRLPKEIFFYSMVGVIDRADPGIDPNTYPLHFYDLPKEIRNRLRFRNFPSPGVLADDERERVEAIRSIRSAKSSKLDAIVASCGHNGRGHNSYWDHINESCESDDELKGKWSKTMELLKEENVLGDVAWLPVNETGIVEFCAPLPVWAATVLDTKDLYKFSQSSGKKFLLMVAPCSNEACTEGSKGRLLHGILGNTRSFVTHLVVDIRSARDYLSIANRY